MDRKTVIRAVIDEIHNQIKGIKKDLASVHKTIDDAPGAMQSHSDTTKFQESGVAQEISQSIQQKETDVRDLEFFSGLGHSPNDQIQRGSIVALSDNSNESSYVILPAGGGTEVTVDNVEIMVITPQSPMGIALLGHSIGEEVEVTIGRRTRNLKILDIT